MQPGRKAGASHPDGGPLAEIGRKASLPPDPGGFSRTLYRLAQRAGQDGGDHAARDADQQRVIARLDIAVTAGRGLQVAAAIIVHDAVVAGLAIVETLALAPGAAIMVAVAVLILRPAVADVALDDCFVEWAAGAGGVKQVMTTGPGLLILTGQMHTGRYRIFRSRLKIAIPLCILPIKQTMMM